MGWLATWFIFELIGVGAAAVLTEPQAFQNVALQMMINQTFTFRRIFHKKLHHIHVFDVRYSTVATAGQGGAVPPLTAACAPLHFGLLKILFLKHHATTKQQTMIEKRIITFRHNFS